MDWYTLQTAQVLPSYLDLLMTQVALYMPRLAFTLLLLYLGLRYEKQIIGWLRAFFDRKPYDEALERFILSLAQIGYKIALIIGVVSIAGIETTSLVAALGAAGFAVGLALQGSMSNFASGILLLTLKPITVDDFIEVNGFSGTVSKIEIFTTTLLTLENTAVIIPNSQLTNSTVINYSKQSQRRVNVTFLLAHGSDIEKAKTALLKVATEHPETLAEPAEPFVRAINTTEAGIQLAVRVWTTKEAFFGLKLDLIENGSLALRKAKIRLADHSILEPHH